ncbi:MAG: hypothetical protein V4691_07645 [Pseudomonadota bacterium]
MPALAVHMFVHPMTMMHAHHARVFHHHVVMAHPVMMAAMCSGRLGGSEQNSEQREHWQDLQQLLHKKNSFRG